MNKTGGRAHSKFSASGAERWFECSASVEASEGCPDIDTEWSKEGTKAHELLEEILTVMIAMGSTKVFYPQVRPDIPREMAYHATNAANFIMGVFKKHPGSEVLCESRVYLTFIHKEAFGTLDASVIDHFGTLHVFDFKYGAGHAVRPEKNLQMIFYALAVAHKHHWNFERVRLWIIQPRIKGYDGPTYWDVPIEVLRSYVAEFTKAVWRVENKPKFKEGPWCHWCKAKRKCPLKNETREAKAIDVFSNVPLPKGPQLNGKEKSEGKDQKESFKSEADWRKGKAKKAGKGRGRRGQGRSERGRVPGHAAGTSDVDFY